MQPALFLDRDGVINKEVHYLHRIEDFEFIEGIFSTCRWFQDNGYLLVVVTNQGGIGRGYYSKEQFHLLNDWMLEQFLAKDVQISQTYFSPYHPTEGIGAYKQEHFDRKPNPGMLLRAKADWQVDLAKSVLVGDKESDIRAGINAGVGYNVLVRSGHAIDEVSTQADAVVDSIADVCELEGIGR